MASVGTACNSVLLKWTAHSPSPSSSESLRIVCGGKRSNAPSLRRKSLRSKQQQQQQSTTVLLPDDILLGVGPGASSLPALQPLLDLDPDPNPDLDLGLPLPQSSSYGGSIGSSLESGKKDKTGTKTPSDRVKGRKNEREEESEWVEVDEEEEGEEKEIVEYWEGDGPPLTPEEEAELLREAEEELAELEKSQGKVWGQITSKQRKSFKSNLSRRRQQQQQQQQQENGVAGNDLASFESMDLEEDDDISAVGGNIAIAERDVSDGLASFESMESEEEDVFLAADRNIADVHSNGFELMESQVEEDTFFVNDGNIADVNSSIQNSNSQQGFDVGYWESGDGDNFDDGLFDETEMDSAEMRPRERKNIPAVMRCFDRAKIYAKAGDGGNGVVAFRREKYVPFGGPSGGSGGNGGNVYVEADPGMNSLLPFRKCVHFRADRGSHGQGKSQIGANGSPCVVKVPVGTIIREAAGHGLAEPGEVLLELTRPGQRELLLPGGRGGRGNTAFKSFRNKAPQIAENGETGAEMWLELELKLVADIGIIGVPNAGKSTLLSVISAAKPAIANYPFTTLLPNLGVVSIGFESSMVVADLPGLLEGAHVGVGLGHEFLRHTERCRVLVHVVDGTGPQPELEYEAVRLELQLFNPSLINKPCIVAFNKMDIPEAASRWKSFQTYLQKKGVETLSMSAATGQGTSEVVQKAYSLFQSLKVDDNFKEDDDTRDLQVGDWVKKQRSAPVDQFKISADKHTRTYIVNGIGVERFAQMTNWEYFEAARRFQHVLTLSGINKALKEEGVQEGDTVIIGEMEFMWHDNEDFENPKGWKRGTRGSKVWPH